MNRLVWAMVARRIGLSLLTLFAVASAIFLVSGALPGDAVSAVLGQEATPETIAALRRELGLDHSLWVQYLYWLERIAHGDLGRSLVTGRQVSELIGARLGNSLMLAGSAALVCTPLALAAGILAAMWPQSLLDRAISTFSIVFLSTPEFFVATLAVLVFSVTLGWLPALSNLSFVSSPLDLLRILAMPVMVLSIVVIAQLGRMTRATLISVLQSPYVEMAALKGASRARIVWRHALPNALGPIAVSAALSLNSLLAGVIYVETIFGYPGITRLMVDAVGSRDMPLMQACAMVFCIGYLVLVTTADVIAILANPKLRTR